MTAFRQCLTITVNSRHGKYNRKLHPANLQAPAFSLPRQQSNVLYHEFQTHQAVQKAVLQVEAFSTCRIL